LPFKIKYFAVSRLKRKSIEAYLRMPLEMSHNKSFGEPSYSDESDRNGKN
jgi:hypothetical protein